MDWAKHAHYHETEGTHPTRLTHLVTVTQDLKRFDLVKHLCDELKGAGFQTRLYRKPPPKERDVDCYIYRREEQKCFIERALPHYISLTTQNWARNYLKKLEKRQKGRPRIPFKCPPKKP